MSYTSNEKSTTIAVNKVEPRTYNGVQMLLITDELGETWGLWEKESYGEKILPEVEQEKTYAIFYKVSGKYKNITQINE